jgi:hypothetical protein
LNRRQHALFVFRLACADKNLFSAFPAQQLQIEGEHFQRNSIGHHLPLAFFPLFCWARAPAGAAPIHGPALSANCRILMRKKRAVKLQNRTAK